MRTAIYARCSTIEQTVDLQLDGLREYALARHFEIVEEYVDEGISGAKTQRPALDRLLADAHRRRFCGVLIWKLDRLARSVRHLTTLAADFQGLGVDLIVLDQGIDTNTSAGRFLFHTLAAVAELERDLIRERTRAGLASARRRGRRLGRREALDSAQKARARRMAQAGRSHRQIAATLGVGKGTIGRLLSPSRPESPSPEAASEPRNSATDQTSLPAL